MGMRKHVLFGLHKESYQVLRLNYYPPCSTPEQVQGLSPHSDTSSITLLMQDDDVTGLEIRHQGGWVPVNPIPDALVVNVGDVTEVLESSFRLNIFFNFCKQGDVCFQSYKILFCFLLVIHIWKHV